MADKKPNPFAKMLKDKEAKGKDAKHVMTPGMKKDPEHMKKMAKGKY